jgi:23S rRNA (cytosine1962-C5)-methyltransferase
MYHGGLKNRCTSRPQIAYWNPMLFITIKQGKEKAILAGDRMIYASAVEKVDGKPNEKMKPGATAVVQSSSKQFIARAAYNSHSQIRARVWTYKEDEPVDHALIKGRVQAALKRTDAAAAKAKPEQLIRRVDSDRDLLSGLIVESFGQGADGYLICQFQSGAVEAWKVAIVQALMAGTGCKNVYERCDDLLRKGEGLPLVDGALAGDEPPDDVLITEGGVKFYLDLRTGQRKRFG